MQLSWKNQMSKQKSEEKFSNTNQWINLSQMKKWMTIGKKNITLQITILDFTTTTNPTRPHFDFNIFEKELRDFFCFEISFV